MEYQKDGSGQPFIEVEFGWESDARLRLTYVEKNQSVRFNKIVPGESPYPGPEPELSKIPLIIEALAKIYNEFKKIE